MAVIQFHLDENIPNAIAQGLQQHGIDVTTTGSAGLIGATDLEQLAFAMADRRVIFTQDSDFLKLHNQGVPHMGIVYGVKDRRSIGEMLTTLILIWEVLTVEEMQGKIEFL